MIINNTDNKERSFNVSSLLDKAVSFILDVLDYAIICLVILVWAVSWSYDARLSVPFDDLMSLFHSLLIIYCILGLIFKSGVEIRIPNYKLLIFTVIVIFSYYSMSTSNKEMFLFRVVYSMVWMFFWLILHTNKTMVWEKYTNVVVAISIIALVFYFGGSVLNIIPELYSVKRVWGGWDPQYIRNFYYLYYESNKLSLGGISLWRNCAIFAEAPMYAHVLAPSLAAELFLRKKPRKLIVIILAISLITSLSTMGIGALVMMSGIYYVKNRFAGIDAKTKKRIIVIASAVLLILIGLFLARSFVSESSGSNTVRLSHTKACWQVFKNNMIVGCGWFNRKAVWEYTEYHQGIAIGLPFLLAMGGLLLFSILLIPVITSFKNAIKQKKYNRFIFDISIFILFFFNIIEPLFELFIIYSLTEKYEDSYEENDEMDLEGGSSRDKKLKKALWEINTLFIAMALVFFLAARINYLNK